MSWRHSTNSRVGVSEALLKLAGSLFSREGALFISKSRICLTGKRFLSVCVTFKEESIGAKFSPKRLFVLTHTHSERLWLQRKLIKLDWVSHTNLFPVKVGLKSELCNTATFWPWFVRKNPSKIYPRNCRTIYGSIKIWSHDNQSRRNHYTLEEKRPRKNQYCNQIRMS